MLQSCDVSSSTRQLLPIEVPKYDRSLTQRKPAQNESIPAKERFISGHSGACEQSWHTLDLNAQKLSFSFYHCWVEGAHILAKRHAQSSAICMSILCWHKRRFRLWLSWQTFQSKRFMDPAFAAALKHFVPMMP